MKFDLFTTIGVALAGIIIAFIVTNALIPSLENYSFQVIDKAQDSDSSYDYSNYDAPDDEIFNYKALNPTVEVYVGDCQQIDSNGNCVDTSVTTSTGEDDEDNQNGEEPSSEDNRRENG